MRRLMTLFGVFSFVVSALLSLFIAIVIIDGFVAWHLWNWFVVKPLGAPAITMWQAIGLAMIVNYMTYHYYPFKKEEEVGLVAPLCYVLVRPALALFFGWLLHFLV